MIFSPAALAAAPGYKGRLYRLISLSALIAVLESTTLLLVFAFVTSLMGTPPSSSGVLQLLSLFHGVDIKLQALLLLVLATTRFSFGLFLEWKMSRLWVDLRAEMQSEMLAKHFNALQAYLQMTKQGEHLHNIITGPAMGAVYYLHLVRFVSTLIMLTVLLLTLFVVSPGLAGIGLCVVIIYGGIIKRISSSISFEQGQKQAIFVRRQTEMAAEGLLGIRYIKALGHHDLWYKEFLQYADEAKEANHKAGFANTVPARTLEYLIIVLFLGIVTLVMLFGSGIAESIPTIAVYFLGIVRILPSLSVLGNGRMQMMNVLPHLQKYAALREEIPQEKVDEGAIQPIKEMFTQNIVFNHVGFGYAEQDVLHDLCLNIEAHSFTAIVGASGQGKSTLLDLLMRIIEPGSGSILIGGVNAFEYNLNGWRSQFGYVGQDPFLFHDTIRNNIKASNTEATEEQIIAAARIACIHDIITGMPDGYDTILADRGHSLSGGQRQRIAIARALVSNARILIMDEPTSALDSLTELNVMQGIQQTWKGGVVLVTHRKELLHHADTILVINEGQVAEHGTLKQLDEKGVLFQQIFRPHAATN